MTNRQPFVGSGRLQEGGALATRKQDFNAHWQGTGFRHDATNIDMNPVIPLVGGATVQETLERLQNLITSAGTGFLSIGSIDGYIQGDYNVGATGTITLYDTFNAAFADVRLTNGGIILVLSGTYHLDSSVTVPAGISIMGEVAGTIIVGEMQEVPMFIIQKSDADIELTTGLSFDTGSNVGSVRFSNLILADNLYGNVLFGEPTMTTAPMIQAQVSSNLICENVSFIGKIHSSVTPRTKTQSAIGYTGSETTGSILKMKDCYMDGLKIGISFTPANDALDFLTVEGCKARIYGTENAASQSAALNSFIVMTHCRAAINNNYFVGAGTYVNTFIDIISGSNGSMVVSGNSGTPYSLVTGKIINEVPGSTYKSVITGNNWGTTIDSSWYIVVGGGSGTSPVGDFNGVSAIDTIISIANSITSFSATVIVNPGTYTVAGNASGNFANLNFIGKKHGKNYPIFQLGLTSVAVDSLGCAPLALGNKVESIQFISINKKHSLRPSFNPTAVNIQSSAHTMEVTDCLFTNVALYPIDLSSLPWIDSSGDPAMTNIVIKDCYFFQDGTFTDTISLILPKADKINIQNCFFTGNGYALSVGSNGYNGNASSVSAVSLRDCIFDLTGYTISSQNLLEKSYIYIDYAIVLNIDNCQIYCDRQYGDSTPIHAALTGSLSQPFSKFIHLLAVNININDCIFVGPTQTFVSSGTTYAMATLFFEPQISGRITNSKFSAGALLLQCGGTAMTEGSYRENLTVENCLFSSSYHTLIDYDLGLSQADRNNLISFNKCNFVNGSTVQKCLHTNTSDATRAGVIQLFTGDAFISFNDNIANVSIIGVSGAAYNAALMINTYDNVGTPGDQITPVVVTNNSFFVTNNFSSDSTSQGAACMLLRSNSMQVQNNKLSMFNSAPITVSFTGCLIIDNVENTINNDSSSIVTGNIFTRRNYLGASSNLVRGYIQISLTSSSLNGGLISNNIFDSTTYNGTSTNLVEDNSAIPSNNISLSNWVITQNKNQTGRQPLTWASGSKGIATGADLGNVILYGGTTTTSSISAIGATSDELVFNYNHTASQDQFVWNTCLSEVLPPDVTITKVEYSYQASAVPATTKSILVILSGADGDTSDSFNIVSTSIFNNEMTASFNHTTKSTDHPYLYIQASINGASVMTFTLSQIFITYHW